MHIKRKSAAAVELGRRGGKKRAANMTRKERSKQAPLAAEARWSKEYFVEQGRKGGRARAAKLSAGRRKAIARKAAAASAKVRSARAKQRDGK